MGITCLSFLAARTWVSADGIKTFEGEYRSYNKESGVVEVFSRGRLMSFSKDKLSEQDLLWLGENGREAVNAGKSAPLEVAENRSSLDQSTMENQVIGSLLLKARLKRYDKRRYRKAKLEKTPEYYLLYYAASWWGPCRSSAPLVIEKYKEHIESNPLIEFIHVSEDEGEGSAENWARKQEFPWLTVLPKQAKRSKIFQYKTRNVVPFYILVDAQGEQLAVGRNKVFAKLTALSGS